MPHNSIFQKPFQQFSLENYNRNFLKPIVLRVVEFGRVLFTEFCFWTISEHVSTIFNTQRITFDYKYIPFGGKHHFAQRSFARSSSQTAEMNESSTCLVGVGA